MAERAPFRGQEAFPPLPDDEHLIWWTCEQDCELIRAMFTPKRPNLRWSEDDARPIWPGYLHDRYSSRYGRNGRGRLWSGTDKVKVVPWPDTALARLIGDRYAGIVIDPRDLFHVIDLPGIVTDVNLEWVGNR